MNLIESLKELGVVFTGIKSTYTIEEHIDCMVRLGANRQVDGIIDEIHSSYCQLYPVSKTDEVATAIFGINEYLDNYYDKVNEVIIKKRRRKKRRPNSDLSRLSKMRWRKNRTQYKKSLKRFHRSSKGKSYHKALGRFNKNNESINSTPTKTEAIELAIASSSALTQLLMWIKDNPADNDLPTVQQMADITEVVGKSILELYRAISLDEGTGENEILDIVEDVSADMIDIFTEWDVEIEDEEE